MPETSHPTNDWFQRMALESLKRVEQRIKEMNERLEQYQDRQIRVEERVDIVLSVIKWLVPVLLTLAGSIGWIIVKFGG